MEVDGRNMDENIISSETTTVTEVIHELVNNDEETRDEMGESAEEDEVTPSITLLTTTVSLESTNNAAPEGRTLKFAEGNKE